MRGNGTAFSAHTLAAQLPGGRVCRDGGVECFDPFDPKPKKRKRPIKIWPDATTRDGWSAADASGKHSFPALHDKLRELAPELGGAFTPRSKNSANGKTHRPAAGPVVSGRSPKDRRNGEGGASRLRLLHFDTIKLSTKRRDLINSLQT